MNRLWAFIVLIPLSCGSTTSSERTMGPAERVPEAPAADECGAAPLLDVEQLEAGEGAGRVVAVEGTPVPEVRCTLLQCGEDECCNTCSGDYELAMPDREHRVLLRGLEGCSGNNCAYDCQPFGREPTRRYRFVGRHEHHPPGETAAYAVSILHLQRYCRAAAPDPG